MFYNTCITEMSVVVTKKTIAETKEEEVQQQLELYTSI